MPRPKTYNTYKSSSAMEGPYLLDADTIEAVVPHEPGVYLLEDEGEDAPLIVCYVGRSRKLSQRLLQHAASGKYRYFRFRCTGTLVNAFKGECCEFHRYGKRRHLDNMKHPERPEGSLLLPCSMTGCLGEPD